ncbi:MAG: hypothetical protein JNM82_17060 [Rhodocyclaceae bacterium]|nr:hypothetical protein [Rhodocyclaceae bacterium]
MGGFENYTREAAELEREITRLGIALGIDWSDDVTLAMLAREALDCRLPDGTAAHDQSTARGRARVELFGLAQLMLTVMQESAQDGLHTHGGAVWKAFGRALWREYERRGLAAN